MSTLRDDSAMSPVCFDEIPAELRELRRWVNWRRVERDGKLTKVPINPKTGDSASSTDSTTWSDYATARARYETDSVDGVGIVLGDGLAGVDLDGHRDPETGVLTPLAIGVLKRLGTYAEVSPSGNGVHALLWATKATDRCRRDDVGVEVYDQGRFFTVTGARLTGVPFFGDAPVTVEQRQGELDTLCARLFEPEESPAGSRATGAAPDHDGQAQRDALSDEEIIRLATTARNGEKVRRLFEGDMAGYVSASEADLALCSLLAFYTGPDAERIGRLFRQSGLFREKWDEPRGELTYGQITINAALEGRTEFYAPRPKRTPIGSSRVSKIRVEFPYWTEALDEMTHKAWDVIGQANEPPFLFRSGSAPVRIEFEDDGSPFLRQMVADHLRHALMEIGEWYYWVETKKGGEWKRVALPAQLIKNMLACPEIPLPLLLGIVEAPVFSADGQLQTTPGYCPATRTYFDASSGITVPTVSDYPSQEEVAEARRLLVEEILGDFPFIGDAERAHAVAMLILPFLRELIPGATPLHLIEKPAPGTGATLLAELPGLLFTGRATTAMTEGRDEDEWRKRLFAKLRKGPSILFIDNLRRRLDSAAFSSAVTAWPYWEDRILGVSETLRVPVRAMWLASGNNPSVSSEVSRRTVRIRLDAKTDRPWLRTEFRHKDLRGWVKENRGRLVWACLTLGRAWFSADRPAGGQVLGMFEEWARVMGGILQVAKVPGFLGNLGEFYEASDDEGAAWRALLAVWWNKHRDRGVGVKELYGIAIEVDGLDLGKGEEQSRRCVLGKHLSGMKDRVFCVDTVEAPDQLRLRLVTDKKEKGAAIWRLVAQGPVSMERLGEVVPPIQNFLHDDHRRPEPEKPPDDTHPYSPEPTAVSVKMLGGAENTHPTSPTPPSAAGDRNPDTCPQCGRRMFEIPGQPSTCLVCTLGQQGGAE